MTESENVIVNGKEVVLYREIETGLYRFSKDAVELLLKSLEENEQYRKLGTVEELKVFRSDDFTQDLLNMGYTKGLKDGYVKAIDDLMEKVTQTDMSNADYRYIIQEVENLKRGVNNG